MNEEALKKLLNKLNIHLNDLDNRHLYAYLVVGENKFTTNKEVAAGALVFKSLNGM